VSRWIWLAFVLLCGCSGVSAYSVADGQKVQCVSNGVIPERACVYSVQQLAVMTGQDHTPVKLGGGYLARRDGTYVLSGMPRGKGPFVVLDLDGMSHDSLPFGLLPLVGWQTVQFGYFTSADVEAPTLRGAVGILHARSFGFHGDAARPAGPHREIVRRQRSAREQGRTAVIFALDGNGPDAQCQRWRLDEGEATRFFVLSGPLDRSASPPAKPGCRVEGLVEADGRTWEFLIRDDGTAEWIGAGEVRHWSCIHRACAELLPSR